MQCISPIKAGWTPAGDLTFSPKNASKELVGFELECRKCLPCRLNIAREKSIRAIHEAQMHENNIFLTLTYNEESLTSPKLQYLDFQLFMKSLRKEHTKNITDPDLRKEMSIAYMVTGEYGDKNKRPHWHAILFNYAPPDSKLIRTTDRGDMVYTSKTITELWGRGSTEFGSVTLDSASYVARYSAKKLIHGTDQEHDYHPIHKTSSKHAIGKRWIEKHWERTFSQGNVIIPSKERNIPAKIPRYYVDWLQKNKPEEWQRYVTQKRHEIQTLAAKRARKEELQYLTEILNQAPGRPRPHPRNKIKLTILNQKFKILQGKLKL